MTAVDQARLAAYDLLREVNQRSAYANLLLPGLLRDRRITGRDAAFATELGYGTLRMSGQLDAILAACSSRPLERVDPRVRDALRLGAYQLLHTRVAAHAAVSSSVELVRQRVDARAIGFANAVLRAVGGRDLPAWLVEVTAAEDDVGALSLSYSHPRWVVNAFADALGGDVREAGSALEADNVRPQVHLVARPGLSTRDELLAAAGPEAVAGSHSPYAVILPGGGDPGGLELVRGGRAGVQDEGSQLAALALAGADMDGPDRRWLDLAAGPGGKAALLAGLAARRGAVLLANEVAPHRAGLVAQALARYPEAWAVVGDGRVPAWEDGTFDRVLLDAPCSGLGALRRRPEARWRRQPADLPALTAIQRGLLAAAVRSTRSGGVVGYVTCSPHLAETRAVIGDALRDLDGLAPIDVRPLLTGFPEGSLGVGPAVQLWPHRHGTDALFIALLRVP